VSTMLPVTVVGGYLGAGKTSLVNHVLRTAAGMRIAVLVNEFGALPVDAGLVEAQDGNVISLAGGCICCAFGSDLMGALMSIARREPRMDRVLVETSGVALPAGVARSAALVPGLSVDGVVLLADAETLRPRAVDRYVGDTIRRQLAEADLVVLNKADLVDGVALAGLRRWLEEAAPQAAVVDAVRGQVALPVLLGIAGGAASAPGKAFSGGEIRPLVDAANAYESESLAPGQVDVAALARGLAGEACGIIRAKGVLADADGTLKVLHIVGSRFEVSPYAGDAAAATGVVCIGLRGRLDRAAIARVLGEAGQRPVGAAHAQAEHAGDVGQHLLGDLRVGRQQALE
jgi:G3E family GTPase